MKLLKKYKAEIVLLIAVCIAVHTTFMINGTIGKYFLAVVLFVFGLILAKD